MTIHQCSFIWNFITASVSFGCWVQCSVIWAAETFCCSHLSSFSLFFFCLFTEVQLCRGTFHWTSSSPWKVNSAAISSNDENNNIGGGSDMKSTGTQKEFCFSFSVMNVMYNSCWPFELMIKTNVIVPVLTHVGVKLAWKRLVYHHHFLLINHGSCFSNVGFCCFCLFKIIVSVFLFFLFCFSLIINNCGLTS